MGCPTCGQDYKGFPPTPPRGEPMPQTPEYWKKLQQMDQELILEQRAQISKDSVTINNLRQKLNKGKS